MKILDIRNAKYVEMSDKEKQKYDKNHPDKYGIRLYPTKMIKLKEPIYIIEMSTSEFQLVSFYLELEKRKPIMNVEIDAKLKGEKQ